MADHPINPEIALVDGKFYAGDLHPRLAWMRQNAPVYWDPNGQVWGIALYDDVMSISKDSETFCNRLGMRPDSPPMPSMINLDGADHKRRRGLVNKGFTVNRVRAYEPKVREICADLIERAKRKGSFDFVHDVAAPLPMIMIGDMLGVAPEDRERLLRWSDDLILGSSMSSPMEALIAAQKAFEEYGEYHRNVVADRRANPGGDDLMSILVHARIDGQQLGDDDLVQESLLILVGGDETTRHVISGGMYELLRHPDQFRALVDDPSKIPTAVEEMLRWVTPIQNMARTATRDVVLRGQTIHEGEKLLLLYPSANRDEAVFNDPLRFDIGRQPNEHLAFGGYGAHFCLGASLARLELTAMFEEIVRRLPGLRLADTNPPPRRPSNFIVGLEALAVEIAA